MEDKKYLKTLLISEAKLKEETLIQKNISARILSATLRKVQDEKLQMILGYELYETILNEAYNKATIQGYVLSDSIIVLLGDYIQPYLLHTVIAALCDTLEFQFTNKGIKKKTDQNSQSTSQSELKALRDKYENESTHYKARLIDYLNANGLSSGMLDSDPGIWEATGVAFDDNSICQPIKKAGGIWSGKSWTPITEFETYDGKLIKKITGYEGGEGELPESLQYRVGMYFGDGKLTFNKDEAVDFRAQDSVDKHFTFNQPTPLNEWQITHGLNKRVSVTVTDTADSVINGQVIYVDDNNVIVRFNSPVSGYAYCN